MFVVLAMKIYTLTIGVNEDMEEVEFIEEQQYNVEDDSDIEVNVPREEDDMESLIKKMIKLKFNIIGQA